MPTPITIHGSRFRGPGFAGPSVIHVGPTNGETNVTDIVVVSDTVITCTLPERDPEWPNSIGVWITTPYGVGHRAGAIHFPPPPVLSVASIVPDRGDRLGGTEVVITGTKFVNVIAVELLYFDDPVAMASYVVDSDTQITAITPAGLPFGSGYTLRVTTLDDSATLGTTTTDPCWRFTQPLIWAASISPSHGSQAGGYVARLVRDPDSLPFTDATNVYLESIIELDFVVIDADTIDVDIPARVLAAPGVPVDINVRASGDPTRDGPASLFTWDLFEANYCEPTSGPAAGGYDIVIHGTSMDTISGVLGIPTVADPLTHVALDGERLQVTIPGASAGTYLLLLSGGDAESANVEFTLE